MGMEVMAEDEFRDQGLVMPRTMPTNGGTIDFIANNVGIKGDAEGLLAVLRRKLEGGQRRQGRHRRQERRRRQRRGNGMRPLQILFGRIIQIIIVEARGRNTLWLARRSGDRRLGGRVLGEP